ncbi:hypothetical protein PIB30_078517 [Stylosanthes scabra]|uniref:Uncharacterized protein n=1 Tax=Stylosanthes scabra TaxID=79078 RepID=A0ABU6QQX2_9FABA|nr:hypothetical protein [Stylosanthes scabra]
MVGIIENVMLQVKDLMFPVDFYILDMPPDTPGRPSHPEKLIEGKASQDGVFNAATTMSTHSKENALVSSKELRHVPPPLRQATKRGRNSPWMWDKKGKKDEGKLDEPGKKNSMKTNGVAENVSYMEWNHSTKLSVLKEHPLEFHHDHSYNKGVDAHLVKDT